jgi:hypothetical protein
MDAPSTAAAHIHEGTPPPGYHQEWLTRTVHLHDFSSRSTVHGARVVSPEFEGFGNQWCVRIYPGGNGYAEEGMVTLYLANMSGNAIEIDYGFSINDGNGKQVAFKRTATPRNFGPMDNGSSRWGYDNFASSSLLLSSLINGTLVIEVHMKLSVPAASSPLPFIPENPFGKQMQRLFLNEKSADIMFEVGEEEQPKNNAMKIAKTSPVTFPAHRCIVENCSSIFAELCESNGDDRTTPIQITGVSPDVFRLLLFYMYGGKVTDDDMKSHAKEIINAADRYGVSSLKLEAEVCLVNATSFSMENLKDILLYADSKNCALLKETAMDYMVQNQDKLLGKVSFHDAPGSLLNDFIAATARGARMSNETDDNNVDNQYNTLRISELRKKAYEKGLNVDGSREMLIDALKKVHELESKGGSEESDEEPVEE